jgi:hypothetical protein
MSEIDVRQVGLRQRERLIERGHRRLCVRVKRGVDLSLLGELPDPFQLRRIGRQLERRVRASQRFGDIEHVFEFLVRHLRGEHLPRVDRHAGVVVHLAQGLEPIHRDRRAPLLQLRSGRALRRHLLWRGRLTASGASTTASR